MAIAFNEHMTLKVWFKDVRKVDLLKEVISNATPRDILHCEM